VASYEIDVPVNLDDYMDDVIAYVSKNLDPKDVFSKDELSEWDSDNDFIHVDDADDWAEGEGYVKEK
jgi:hypothetical protein